MVSRSFVEIIFYEDYETINDGPKNLKALEDL